MGKIRQGTYTPKHPEKYKGTYPICWRSSWELKVLIWLDENPNVINYSSESVVVPYFHPIKKRMARYFPDFYASFKDKDGNINRYIIELKPYKETILPTISKGKRQKTKLYEELTYVINQEKWKAAEQFCKMNGLKFKIITEKELFKFSK